MAFLRKQHQILLKTLEAYQAAVNEAAIVSITDINGKILYVNNKFVEISKYAANELIGNTHRIINSGHHPDEFFKQMWETIRQGKHWRGEIKNKTKDGDFYWVDTVITPVLDEKKRIFQYLSVRNPITVQKAHEEKLIRFQHELMKRERQLKEAQQVAKTGSWYLDLAGNSLEWSEETYRIFEMPPGTPMTYESFLEKVHPDDRLLVNESWQAALKGALYELEHRIETPYGVKWVNERAHLEFDQSFSLKGAVGTIQDVTEKKKTEDILRESETMYRNLFNHGPFPKGILDKETLQFVEVNETATGLYGYSREEFLQLTAYDIRVVEEHDQLKEQLEKGEYAWGRNVRSHKKKNGDIIKIEPFITEITYKGKQAFLITINDVTENIMMQEQLINAKNTRQKEITRASMEAQEKNRAEIGRELHDNVNQLLVASNLYLKNVQSVSDKDRFLIDNSVQLNAAAIHEIRKLSSTLVPPSLDDLSLKESIEDLSLNFKLTNTIVRFDIVIDETSLQQGLKLNIYRIIQEQCSNIIKYAEATNVTITMKQDGNLLTLEVSDNGKGFDQNQKSKGIGLANIIHRAEAYNGSVYIDSSPGNGCRMYIGFTLAI